VYPLTDFILYNDSVLIESITAQQRLDAADEVALYERSFDQLRAAAATRRGRGRPAGSHEARYSPHGDGDGGRTGRPGDPRSTGRVCARFYAVVRDPARVILFRLVAGLG